MTDIHDKAPSMADTGLSVINVDQLSHAVSEAVNAAGAGHTFLESIQEVPCHSTQKFVNNIHSQGQPVIQSTFSINEHINSQTLNGPELEACTTHNGPDVDSSATQVGSEHESTTSFQKLHENYASLVKPPENVYMFRNGQNVSADQFRYQMTPPASHLYPMDLVNPSDAPQINMNIAIHVPDTPSQTNPSTPNQHTLKDISFNSNQHAPSTFMSPPNTSHTISSFIIDPSVSPQTQATWTLSNQQLPQFQTLTKSVLEPSSLKTTPSFLSPSLILSNVQSTASPGAIHVGQLNSQGSNSGVPLQSLKDDRFNPSYEHGSQNQESQEQSTFAPSIIANSIHSLQTPGATDSNNQRGTPLNKDTYTQQMSIPSSNPTSSRQQSTYRVISEFDIQNLALQLAHIEPEKRREHVIQEAQGEEIHKHQDEMMWCVDCESFYHNTCLQHGKATIVKDATIPKRAKLTLPSMLYLKPSSISSEISGVYAKQDISKACRFGPLEGEIILKTIEESEELYPKLWKVFQEGKQKHTINTTREDICNWMMYVQKARKKMEQNVVAYQSGLNIYFVTNQPIKKDEELLLWYSREYSAACGATISPEDSFKCSLCSKQFARQSQLLGHFRYSHPDQSSRRYKCTSCPMAFSSSTKLHLHSFKHTGVKPYKCKICNKSFSDGSNLRQHEKIHSGEKRFTCSVCNKAFRQKAHLITHMVIHTGERKLKCQICEKTFGRSSDIKQHMLLHCQNKQYSCPVCNRIFVTRQLLTKHMVSHSSERKYKCKNCHKTYKTSTHLKRHVKTSCGKTQDTVNKTLSRSQIVYQSVHCSSNTVQEKKTISSRRLKKERLL